jgi:hypothetical protein
MIAQHIASSGVLEFPSAGVLQFQSSPAAPNCELQQLRNIGTAELAWNAIANRRIIAPPGTVMRVTGYSRPWRVTVRPAMMPTDAPNTASLSQWRFAGSREIAT